MMRRLYLITWHVGLFVVLTLGQIGVQVRVLPQLGNRALHVDLKHGCLLVFTQPCGCAHHAGTKGRLPRLDQADVVMATREEHCSAYA